MRTLKKTSDASLEACITLLQYIVEYTPNNPSDGMDDPVLVADRIEFHPDCGLCYNLEELDFDIGGEYSFILADLYEGWDKSTGSTAYPVPDPRKKGKAPAEYRYYHVDNMYYGEYGELRKDLARYCLSKFEEEYYERLK